jgi:hypothetical protein
MLISGFIFHQLPFASHRGQMIVILGGNKKGQTVGNNDLSSLVVPTGLVSKRVLKYFKFLYQNVGKCLHLLT